MTLVPRLITLIWLITEASYSNALPSKSQASIRKAYEPFFNGVDHKKSDLLNSTKLEDVSEAPVRSGNQPVKLAMLAATSASPDSDGKDGAETNPEQETESTARKPVKLNMKQGLTMNQVIGVYSLNDVANPLCRNHTKEFEIGLRAFEPWALQMFDSSTKLQSGVLLGNLMEFGSYTQCVQIYHNTPHSGAIRGKLCTIRIEPDINLLRTILGFRNITRRRFEKVHTFVRNAALMWSICLPDSCRAEDVMEHFPKIIYSFLEGLNVTASIEEKDCSTITDHLEFTQSELLIVSCFGGFFTIILIVTLADMAPLTSPAVEAGSLKKIFSLKRHATDILAQPKAHNPLDCLHGIRFLSTCYVVIGHRYLMMMFFPIINSLQIMDWVLYYRSTAITGGTLCVDTFFMISGMLVSIGFFKQVDSRGNINWLLFYLYRYLRITVPLAIIVLVYSKLMHHFGSGPLWNDMLEVVQKPCQQYWWAVLLHVQNYVHPFPLCMTQAWYLTCDMQYYFLTPIILLPLWKYPILGYLVYFVVYVASIVINFYLSWKNNYDGGVPITSELFSTKYFKYHYITPHTRAATYIIGLGLGCYVHKTKEKKYRLSVPMVVFCWILALSTMLGSLVGCHVFHLESHDYNKLQASVFISCSRSAWTLALAWIVWACSHGYGGGVNLVLSSHVFRVLGRMSYSIYLIHMLLQYSMSGANKLPLYFSDYSSVHSAFGDLFTVLILGFFFTICFESPLIKLLGLLATKEKPSGKVSPTNQQTTVKCYTNSSE